MSISQEEMSGVATEQVPLLAVDDIRVAYGSGARANQVLHGVSFEVGRGEMLAIVGESGSGKSTLAQALMRLLPAEAQHNGGTIRFDGTTLDRLPARTMRTIRGRRIGYVPQDPSNSLNPLLRVGEQIAESLRRHLGMTAFEAADRAREIIAEVGIPDPERRAKQYPHELSGGLRQRILIGIAWACEPELVIADEPTSALDATVQRHVLDRIEKLSATRGTSVVLITHDLAVAADRADRIIVMQKGEIVEAGRARDVLDAPSHPYTQRLVAAAPGLNSRRLEPSDDVVRESAPAGKGPLLSVDGLVKVYPGSGGVPSVEGVSFDIERGTTFSIVGESGSGKSTTARMIARIIETTQGSITFDGADITQVRGEQLRQLRRRVQVVYQNPFGSLDPRMKVGEIIAEPLRAFRVGSKVSRRAQARELITQVGLSEEMLERRPAQLSGGQRQRVAIARALGLRPEFILLDEPVSALDVSVQEQVLQLLVDLQASFGLTYLFISHDLGVIRQISDHIAVMKDGQILEQGPAASILNSPQTPYTRELLGAIPGEST